MINSYSFSPQDKQIALKQHIVTMLNRYANSSVCWDVVNEAVADSGPNLFKGIIECKVFKKKKINLFTYWKDNVWYPDVPDYVDYSFITARQASPTLKVL